MSNFETLLANDEQLILDQMLDFSQIHSELGEDQMKALAFEQYGWDSLDWELLSDHLNN